MKFSIFATEKILSILHGHVFVMICIGCSQSYWLSNQHNTDVPKTLLNNNMAFFLMLQLKTCSKYHNQIHFSIIFKNLFLPYGKLFHSIHEACLEIFTLVLR